MQLCIIAVCAFVLSAIFGKLVIPALRAQGGAVDPRGRTELA